MSNAERRRYQSTIDSHSAAEQSHVMESTQEKSVTERSLVSVVDDDESIRESLPDLLGELGFAARTFSSAEAFLTSDCVDVTRCLILDIAMPGMTGLDLQEELTRSGREIPIIFITAKRDEAIRARVLERGAVKFLYKPFSDTALLDALNEALQAN
jgi:FixJ family two-component response regulator